jgi:oligopeptide/dipeptide ABC transporter ATP-binding protein
METRKTMVKPDTIPDGENILEVRDLKTQFKTINGIVKAVDGVSLQVKPKEVLGIVGESGCGKSVTSRSILRLITKPGKIVKGEILFKGRDLLKLPETEMEKIRGKSISMIFQQPQNTLNPLFTVGRQIGEVFRIHSKYDGKDIRSRTLNLLKQVGIPDAETKIDSHPFEMSGGQAQRVMIAMALAFSPDILIADEPTTALDVTIQAQILDILMDLKNAFSTAIIMITHDMGVIAETADRVAVMYAGAVVEQAKVEELFEDPRHPYTKGLLKSIPKLGENRKVLHSIPGTVPNLIDEITGCRFASRCEFRMPRCAEEEPPLIPVGEEEHLCRCWLEGETDE